MTKQGILSIALPAFAAGAFLFSVPAFAYPAHQCFKSVESGDYCSCQQVKNHDAGADWVSHAVSTLHVTVRGKPYESETLPPKATWWPKPCSG